MRPISIIIYLIYSVISFLHIRLAKFDLKIELLFLARFTISAFFRHEKKGEHPFIFCLTFLILTFDLNDFELYLSSFLFSVDSSKPFVFFYSSNT